MKFIPVLLVLLVCNAFAGSKEKTVYHNVLKFEFDYDVVEWDVDTANLAPMYVIETIDSAGRVVMLQLMEKGKVIPQNCDIIPVITYEYFDDKIVQKSFREKNKIFTVLECGAFQKTVYFLSGDSVTGCMNYQTDLSSLKKPTKKDPENYHYFYKDMVQLKLKGRAEACLGIIGYSFSMAKMNGKDPGIKP